MALNPKQFGTIMKNARMDKKLTQAELAEILDLSLSYLKDLERFKNTPSLEVFAKAIQYFNLSADTVIYPNKNLVFCALESFESVYGIGALAVSQKYSKTPHSQD